MHASSALRDPIHHQDQACVFSVLKENTQWLSKVNFAPSAQQENIPLLLA